MFLLTGSPKTRVPALRNQLCRGAFLITEKTSRVRGGYNRIEKIQKGGLQIGFFIILFPTRNTAPLHDCILHLTTILHSNNQLK